MTHFHAEIPRSLILRVTVPGLYIVLLPFLHRLTTSLAISNSLLASVLDSVHLNLVTTIVTKATLIRP